MNLPRAGSSPTIRLPPLFFVVSVSASLFFAAGLIGFLAPGLSTLLADRSLATACLVAGGLLEVWAVAILVLSLRRRSAGH